MGLLIEMLVIVCLLVGLAVTAALAALLVLAVASAWMAIADLWENWSRGRRVAKIAAQLGESSSWT